MAIETATCVLCGRSEYSILFSATEGIERGQPQDYYSSSRARAGHFSIVRCDGCGLVRSLQRDDAATRQKVYTRLQDQVYEEETTNRQTIFRRRVNAISHSLPGRGKLLDIGCSTGLFAAEAIKQGWQVTGIDPSAWAVAKARKRAPTGQFSTNTVENMSFPGKLFDVITLWDVLEHLDHPGQTLSQLKRWLAPGGQVHLNLPNIDSVLARLMGRNWPYLLREHLWYFSPQSISRLMRNYHYDIVAIRPNYVRFSAENIGRRMGQYSGILPSIASWLGNRQGISKLSFWFPTGEMEITARIMDDKK